MFLTFIKILSTKEQSSQNNLLFVSVFSNISSLLNIYERVFCEKSHCVKSVLIRTFSGPYFSAFGLNMERHGVSFRIQSEFGKVRTRNTPNINTFHSVNNWLKAGKKLYHRSLTGTLTNSFSMHPFSTPWKHQKTWRFSDVFKGYRERLHWEYSRQKGATLPLTLHVSLEFLGISKFWLKQLRGIPSL